MPLSRPGATPATAPPTPFKIARAQLAGMSPGEAHEAILGALVAAEQSVTDTTGMINQAVIDGAIATLTETRKIIHAHAPVSLVSNDPEKPAPKGVWCSVRTDDPVPTWPCLTYREAAATIADGLSKVALP